ncbi:MAG TPA: aromatic amino acid transport family protein [Candidatus Paceibacterota bacterium]|nr:aromatic amino acid transport family protein [Candidatus Pacearchaeota archaeon]HRZ50584.1 aromatic amino acid transport family protein [Candidatus Paceibacterota bacterium]HSA36305.1 aromatic amino acid transport family protein [Candidatus Paceibacterota bacterium]
MKENFPFYSLATLCNTTIGIGIFALPYIASRVGIGVMAAYFLVLGFVAVIIHLMFAEVALSTPDYKRFPGFVKIHLGAKAEWIALVCTIVGFLASMIAFMVIGGQFLQSFFSPWLSAPENAFSIAYFLAGSLFIYLGINLVSKIELWGLVIFFTIMGAIMIIGLPSFQLSNLLVNSGTGKDLLLPYGAVLFALWASSSIPEVEEMLGRENRKKFLKPVVVWSSALSLFAYVSFIILIIGLTGGNTTQSALMGLKPLFGNGLLSLCFLFGFITSFTSFIIIGLTLKKILAYDLKINKLAAWSITAATPLALYLAGIKDFIAIFSFVGGILLSIDGIMIVMMYQKIRPEKNLIAYPLILFFIGGIIYELAYSLW